MAEADGTVAAWVIIGLLAAAAIIGCCLCYHYGFRRTCNAVGSCLAGCLSCTNKYICTPCVESIHRSMDRRRERLEERRRQKALQKARELRITEYSVETMLARYNSDNQTLTPEYWQFYPKSSRPSLVDVVSSAGSTSHRTELAASSDLFKAVKRLIEDSWMPHAVGYGLDARGLQNYYDISVRRVWLIENPQLYISYLNKRRDFYLKATRRPFPPIDRLRGEAEVHTKELVIETLDKMVDININEYYLIHGTKPATLDAIVDQGLDNRLSPGGLFGNGIYLAERSTKSDQYADDVTQRVGFDVPLNLFVVRALLGSTYVCNESRDFRRPPCSARGCYTANCLQHTADMYDSVLGVSRGPREQRLLFREFIVYDKYQCYPEFLVEYVRVPDRQSAYHFQAV